MAIAPVPITVWSLVLAVFRRHCFRYIRPSFISALSLSLQVLLIFRADFLRLLAIGNISSMHNNECAKHFIFTPPFRQYVILIQQRTQHDLLNIN